MNDMRSNPRAAGYPVLSVPALVLTVGSAWAMAYGSAPVLPVSQERTVSAYASADDAASGDSDTDHDQAVDFGHFVGSVGATAEISSGFVVSDAYQDSTITGDGILATGNIGYGVFLGGVSGGWFSASSELHVTFMLTRSSDYTLDGTLSVNQAGFSSLKLEGPAGTVHAFSTFGSMIAVNQSGTLPAGQYTLHVLSRIGFSGASGPITFDGSAAYGITLNFDHGGGGPGGEVPDGEDVPGDPLRVEKLANDLVRLTWGFSCRPADDDYVVYEGPIGDPFGLLPVTCSTAGQLSYDFEPTLDAAAFLVVPTDGATEGSYGDTSGGVERSPSAAACRPQFLGAPVCP